MPDGLIDRLKAQAPPLPSHAPVKAPDIRSLVTNVAMQEPLMQLEPWMASAGQDVLDAWARVKAHLIQLGQQAEQAAGNLLGSSTRAKLK